MIVGYKYDSFGNFLWYKTGNTIEIVKHALNETTDEKFNKIPVACIYDFNKKEYLYFDEKYLRYKERFDKSNSEFKF